MNTALGDNAGDDCTGASKLALHFKVPFAAVEREQPLVVAADVHDAVGDARRRKDDVLSREAPTDFPVSASNASTAFACVPTYTTPLATAGLDPTGPPAPKRQRKRWHRCSPPGPWSRRKGSLWVTPARRERHERHNQRAQHDRSCDDTDHDPTCACAGVGGSAQRLRVSRGSGDLGNSRDRPPAQLTVDDRGNEIGGGGAGTGRGLGRCRGTRGSLLPDSTRPTREPMYVSAIPPVLWYAETDLRLSARSLR